VRNTVIVSICRHLLSPRNTAGPEFPAIIGDEASGVVEEVAGT